MMPVTSWQVVQNPRMERWMSVTCNCSWCPGDAGVLGPGTEITQVSKQLEVQYIWILWYPIHHLSCILRLHCPFMRGKTYNTRTFYSGILLNVICTFLQQTCNFKTLNQKYTNLYLCWLNQMSGSTVWLYNKMFCVLSFVPFECNTCTF